MYYKTVKNGYILSISTGSGEIEITEEEYNAIMSAILNKPAPTESIDYMLKEDLTWEAVEIEQGEDEPTAEELLDILTGEAE